MPGKLEHYIVVQEAKKEHLRSIFAVFLASSKAEALRRFEDYAFGADRKTPSGKFWKRPYAELLVLGKEYTL